MTSPIVRASSPTVWTAVLSASAAVIGSFLPWGRSGQTSRTSYELIGVAGRLDVLEGRWAGLASLWLLVPVLTAPPGSRCP